LEGKDWRFVSLTGPECDVNKSEKVRQKEITLKPPALRNETFIRN